MKTKYILFTMVTYYALAMTGCAHTVARSSEPLICTGLTIKTWGATWCPGCQQLERQIKEHQEEVRESDPGQSCSPSDVRVTVNGKTIVATVVHIDTTDLSDEERMASGQLTNTIPEVQIWSPTGDPKKPRPVRLSCKAYTPTVAELQTLLANTYEKSGKEGYKFTRDCPR